MSTTCRTICVIAAALLGPVVYSSAAVAQQSFTTVVCRSGTISELAKGDDMLIYTLDHSGVIRSEDDRKLFDNWAERCVGGIATIAGKRSGGGWCKSIDPANGDSVFIEWSPGEGGGAGSFRYVHGTGAWKGISGRATYDTLARTRAVQPGTYQNCIRVKGTVTAPKLQ